MTKLLDLNPQRRDAILNAALKEFSSKGYDNASTNVIAKEAGISKALMFHYVSNKQELFLVVYDYFFDLIKNEYLELMNYDEKDIFDRLRQSYHLQIKLWERYPWIFDFHKLLQPTKSKEVSKELENRVHEEHSSCSPKLFDGIEEAKFKVGLDIEKCKQFILWVNVGFTNEILEDIRYSESQAINYELFVEKLDGYFDELRKIYYK
ncbi:TetR/AcrR family transcriptional regulator [Lysinibacillus pakistanensis]|uniref:TetR/AcrR family transcriptional regulator n=1 Tax=Lysinibacillus pakistanensis TaxID=759811 RepID=A0AAX3WQR9_9BACI|nr:TetR/AcrR family transcriptional regulator [Lysinibacillus pakistanensis]MDM5233654.1 TetR/AcrR family transcriptional regulator [Lysinibacillus pakistanensis]WHY44281.1 TetR/AcrR family transcriptional regulator [Lysinibacillus pakistanensis]WHY49288.1 TetR/AcrR family transcriptional regulator [Lysinibacillus pakistanensis]